MKQTAYELLALLDRNLRESIILLKRLTACPGQRSDVLVPLSNEVQNVRAQIGFEVTSEANDFEQANQTYWSRIHHKYLQWLKDPDDVYIDVEEREELRKKKGLPPRVIILPWSFEQEEKLLAVKRSEAKKKRKQNQGPRKGSKTNRQRKERRRHESEVVSETVQAHHTLSPKSC